MSGASYPLLDATRSIAAPAVSFAVVKEPTQQLTCSKCGQSLPNNNSAECQRLAACDHLVHRECFVMLAKKFPTAVLGGQRHCKHCCMIPPTRADGTMNIRLFSSTCLEEACQAYISSFDQNLEALCEALPPTDDDLLALLGPIVREENVKETVLKHFG